MLFLDDAYATGGDALCFRRAQPPTAAELDGLIAHIRRYLERQGLLVRDVPHLRILLKLEYVQFATSVITGT